MLRASSNGASLTSICSRFGGFATSLARWSLVTTQAVRSASAFSSSVPLFLPGQVVFRQEGEPAVDRFLNVGDGVGGSSADRLNDQDNDGGEATHGEPPGPGGSDRQAGG